MSDYSICLYYLVLALFAKKPAKSEFIQNVDILLQKLNNENLKKNQYEGEILYKSAEYLCLNTESKKARPWLTYLFGQALEADFENLAKIAAAAEMVHSASLLHDDVIDQGTTRRGKPSVNVLYSNTVAVLSGDLLLTESLELIHDLDSSITLSALNVVKQMTIATSKEFEFRYNTEVTRDQWLSTADGKTGILFGWCGLAAGILAGDLEAAKVFEDCGRKLGVAFQIADDLKDFYADSPNKRRYADIYNGNPNYAVILAAEEDREIKAELSKIWSKQDSDDAEIKEFAEKIKKAGAIDKAFAVMRKEIEEALSSLSAYKEREGISQLVEWVNALGKGIYGKAALKWSNIIDKVKSLKAV